MSEICPEISARARRAVLAGRSRRAPLTGSVRRQAVPRVRMIPLVRKDRGGNAGCPQFLGLRHSKVATPGRTALDRSRLGAFLSHHFDDRRGAPSVARPCASAPRAAIRRTRWTIVGRWPYEHLERRADDPELLVDVVRMTDRMPKGNSTPSVRGTPMRSDQTGIIVIGRCSFPPLQTRVPARARCDSSPVRQGSEGRSRRGRRAEAPPPRGRISRATRDRRAETP